MPKDVSTLVASAFGKLWESCARSENTILCDLFRRCGNVRFVLPLWGCQPETQLKAMAYINRQFCIVGPIAQAGASHDSWPCIACSGKVGVCLSTTFYVRRYACTIDSSSMEFER